MRKNPPLRITINPDRLPDPKQGRATDPFLFNYQTPLLSSDPPFFSDPRPATPAQKDTSSAPLQFVTNHPGAPAPDLIQVALADPTPLPATGSNRLAPHQEPGSPTMTSPTATGDTLLPGPYHSGPILSRPRDRSAKPIVRPKGWLIACGKPFLVSTQIRSCTSPNERYFHIAANRLTTISYGTRSCGFG